MASTRLAVALAVTAFGCSNAPAAPGAPPAAIDAGLDADASAGADASGSLDAPAGDVADALTDVTPVAASHWCDGQLVVFCDDFDENAIAQGWDGLSAQHGSVALDGATYTSPAQSMLASTTALSIGAVAYARLGKRFSEASAKIRLAFDVHPDAVDPSIPVAIATVQLLDASGQSIETINLVLQGGGASIDDEAVPADGGSPSSVSHPFSPAPAVGAWTRVEIDLSLPVDAGVGDGTISVSVGGSATPSLDRVPLGAASQPAMPLVFLGVVTGQGPATACAVRFDDVTFSASAF